MYVEILRRLKDAVRRKHPENWARNSWFLLLDNTPAHGLLVLKQIPCEAQCDGFGASAVFPRLVIAKIFLVVGY
jgi:hypothetical protein